MDHATDFGRNLGIAFQLIDDLLDFVESADSLGKPAAVDLELGLATAPVLYALEEFPELKPLIERKFSQEGDVEKVFYIDRISCLTYAHTLVVGGVIDNYPSYQLRWGK